MLQKKKYIPEKIAKDNDYIDKLYNAGLITAGAMALSFVSKKVVKDSLGLPSTLVGAGKLAGAVGVSTIGIEMLQKKNYIPSNAV